jgi:hypothetical protein
LVLLMTAHTDMKVEEALTQNLGTAKLPTAVAPLKIWNSASVAKR